MQLYQYFVKSTLAMDDKCYDKSQMKSVVGNFGNLGVKKFDYIHCNTSSKELPSQFFTCNVQNSQSMLLFKICSVVGMILTFHLYF